MKTKIYSVTLIAVLMVSSLFAQERKLKRPDQDKMKAFKIAYITDKLDLTVEEAEKFWPIYNENEKIMAELRKQEGLAIKKYIKERSDIENITEDQAKEIVSSVRNIEEKIDQQKEKIYNRLKKILPYKKMLKLQVAEREFKRSLLRKLKKRRKDIRESKGPRNEKR